MAYQSGGSGRYGRSGGGDSSESGLSATAQVIDWNAQGEKGPTGDSSSGLGSVLMKKGALDLFKAVEDRYTMIAGRWQSEVTQKLGGKPKVNPKTLEYLTLDPAIK
jgi:hypothetical protein